MEKSKESEKNPLTQGEMCYIPPVAGKIAIAAYNPIPFGQPLTQAAFKQVEESGCNCILWNQGHHQVGIDDFNDLCDGLDGTNLKIIMMRALGKNQYPKLLNYIDTFKNPRLIGWNVFDEPTYADLFPTATVSESIPSQGYEDFNFPDSDVSTSADNDTSQTKPKNFKELYTMARENIIQANRNIFIYFNLAVLESANLTDNMKYPAYLNKIKNEYNPPLWSFDSYPVKVNTGSLAWEVRKETYANIQYFHDISETSGSPFWAYCLTTPHTVYSNPSNEENVFPIPRYSGSIYPEPTEGVLRFQAFTALAYGAKGLVYWTYGQIGDKFSGDSEDNPSLTSFCTEKYFSAPVNRDGVKTAIWDTVKKINQEISVYSSMFAQSKGRFLAHLDNPQYYNNLENRKLILPKGIITSLTISLYDTGDGNLANGVPSDTARICGVLVSGLQNLNVSGQYYLVLVNHSPFNGCLVDIQLKSNAIWQCWLKETREEYPQSPASGQDIRKATLPSLYHFNKPLVAGGYLIIGIKNTGTDMSKYPF